MTREVKRKTIITCMVYWKIYSTFIAFIRPQAYTIYNCQGVSIHIHRSAWDTKVKI
jgi:hypothetical protein